MSWWFSDPAWVHSLSNLGKQLQSRYEQTGDEHDIEEAIGLARLAVESTPEDDLARASSLSELGSRLQSRYERTSNVYDIEEAIRLARLAVESTPEDDLAQARSFSDLSGKLEIRYRRFGKIQDLDEAIQLGLPAVKLTAQGDPTWVHKLSDIENELRPRSDQMGQKHNIEEVIELGGQFGELSANRRDHDRATRLCRLGTMLALRYRQRRDMQDFDDSISVTRQAVELCPIGEAEKISWLSSLADHLETRFTAKGDIHDAEESVKLARRALQWTHDGDPAWMGQLCNLGNKLRVRYDYRGDVYDIEDAIELARQVVELTPKGDPDQPSRLSNLGDALYSRYCRLGEIQDLEDAILVTRQAVELIPESDPALAPLLSSLGTKIQGRYDRTENTHDLTEAVQLTRRAVELGPKYAPGRATWLRNLGNALEGHYYRFREMKDLEAAILVTRQAVDLTPRGDPALPAVLESLGNKLQRQYDRTKDRHGLTEAIRLTRQAVELTPEDDPARASRLRNLAIGEESRYLQTGLMRHLNAAVRCFCRSCNSPRGIPLVRLQAGREAIRLFQQLGEWKKVVLWTKSLTNLLQQVCSRYSDREDQQHAITQISGFSADAWAVSALEWLWYNCVKLILDDLEKSGLINGNDVPRIWWIGSGIASSFPFHAAGVDSHDSRENTLSRVISSYSPTIKALEYSRLRALQHDQAYREDTSVLVVTMPTTPNQESLKGVEREKEEIRKACEGVYSHKFLEMPTVADVLGKMLESDIVHFACHGSSDPANPSDSHLLLQNSILGEVVVDKLTVSSISSISSLPNARVLSACSTAETKASGLVDEGLHLASAFQVAGFAHVIGSLWSAEDDACVRLAKYFYMDLIKSGSARVSNRSVASALRSAVLQVRSEFRDGHYFWAPFIHIGA